MRRAIRRWALVALLTCPAQGTAAVQTNPDGVEDGYPAPIAVAPLDEPAAENDIAKDAGRRPAPPVEEIVVTARRTEEFLQDVPIAISVLDARALAERNITTTNDLVQSVPGLSGTNPTDRNRTVYSMRGQSEAFFGSSPGVVGYFAEVPEFSSFIYDLASVQVLKGPQGTLFGRNTTGGAVLLTPQKPTEEPGGYVSGRLGNDSRMDVEFAYGGPLIAGLASFRIAGQLLHRDGYTQNLARPQRLDDEGRSSARLSLVLTPFETLENYTVLQYERLDENGTSAVLHAFVDAPTTPYRGRLSDYLEEQQARGPRTVGNDAPLYYRGESRGVINNTTWDISDVFSLKNIFSYRKWAFGTYADEDGSPFRILNIGTDRPTTPTVARTEELQLLYDAGALSAVVGVYYESTEKAYDMLNSQLTLPLALVPYGFHVYSGSDNTSRAVFAHLDVEPLEKLSLGFGYRRTTDDRREQARQALAAAGVEVDTLRRTSLRNEYTADTWSASASYRLTASTTGYLTLRRGYKTGGFNPTASSPERVAYAPEYVDSHEVGIKGRWLIGDWWLHLNADLFYDDYRDIQRSLVQPTIPPSAITANAAAATVRGGDLDLLVVPSELITVALQYTYVDAGYARYDDPQLGDLSDGMFPNTPEHQLVFSPRLRWWLPADCGALSLLGTWYWQSRTALDVTNTPNGTPRVDRAVVGSLAPAYSRIDLRAEWQSSADTGLSIAAYVRNLGDSEYAVGGINTLGVDIVGAASRIYGPPRMYGIELRYGF